MRSFRPFAAAVVVLALGFPARAAALTACSAAAVIAQDAGCPPGPGACEITKAFETGTPDQCVFDFESRPVVLKGRLEGESLRIQAGSLTLAPTATIRVLPVSISDEDFYGGTVEVSTTGDFVMQRTPPFTAAHIDASAPYVGGYITINAGGQVILGGEITADGTGRGGSGGVIEITAANELRTEADSLISANGGLADFNGPGYSGAIFLQGDSTLIAGRVLMYGDDPESALYISGGQVVISGRVSTDGYYTNAGATRIDVASASTMLITGELSAQPGPSLSGDPYGGASSAGIDVYGQGDVVIEGTLTTDGPLHGCPGRMFVRSDSELRLAIGSIVSASANRLRDPVCGEFIDIRAPRVLASGTIAVRNATSLFMQADELLHLGGVVEGRDVLLDSSYYPFEWEERHLELVAGSSLDQPDCSTAGELLVDADLDFDADGCDGGICADPGQLLLRGCTIAVAAQSSIRARAQKGATLDIDACRSLELAGSIDVSGVEKDGSTTIHTCAVPPGPCTLAGTIGPPPLRGGGCLACPGDCDGSGAFSAVDLQTIVGRINLCERRSLERDFLLSCALPACPSGDLNDDGVISAAELTQVIARDATAGCPKPDL